MADLGEVNTGGSWRRYLRLAGALAALLAGLLVLTAGGANLVTGLLVEFGLPLVAARQIAIATVSTLPPVVLGGTLVMTTGNRQARLVGLAGVAIALTGVAVGLPLGFASAAPIVALIYGIGIFLVIGSLLHGYLIEDQQSSGATAGWRSDSIAGTARGSGSGAMPADGGEDDSDLTFLLEDEDDHERD